MRKRNAIFHGFLWDLDGQDIELLCRHREKEDAEEDDEDEDEDSDGDGDGRSNEGEF